MTTVVDSPIPPPTHQPAFKSSKRVRIQLHRAAFWSSILLVAIIALVAGLIVRRFAWDQTADIHFVIDVSNAFRQGSSTLRVGYLNQYDLTYRQGEEQEDGDYNLDYGPGRLGIATIWANWVQHQVPNELWYGGFYATAARLGRLYELVRPMLMVNIASEILSAVAMFLLVRRWTSGGKPPGAKSAILGLISAIFFWFNPGLISNAHCWPQWDCWVLPFLFWALVAASYEWWFTAGVLIAVGAMFKGQTLFAAPFFILWSIFRLQFIATLRWLSGCIVGFAACTAVWLVRKDGDIHYPAIVWACTSAFAMVALYFVLHARLGWPLRLIFTFLVVGLLLWPFAEPSIYASNLVSSYGIALLSIGAVTLVFWLAPRKYIPLAAVTHIAIILFLCVPIFDGSMAWFHIGIAYGTRHYPMMASGPNNNLAELLRSEWDWMHPLQSAFTLPPGRFTNLVSQILSTVDRTVTYRENQPIDIPLKYVMVTIYGASVVLSSLGAAIHSKRNSRRFLVAVTAPWIVFFSVMTQMHQRYLLWGACLGASTVALGPGWAGVNIFISLIAFAQEMQSMMAVSRQFHNPLYRLIESFHPGIAWALLLVAAIHVYVAVTPERRSPGLVPAD